MATTDIVTLTDTPRNDIVDAIVGLIDTGAGSEGDIVIRNTGQQILVIINLNAPSFGAAASGTATMTGSPNPTGTGLNGGIADRVGVDFQMRDRDNNIVFTGDVDVTASSAALRLSSTTINDGDTVELTAASSTITQPAS